jgi:cellulose synthase/poly-beta-1,6-N-acetylglucosamine synthase-like glycosyltransferase
MVGFQIVLAALCLASIAGGVIATRNARHLRRLADLPSGPLEAWPPVSLVITARDEAETVGPALATRLAEDYPELEIIFVDDRSTDGTAAIVRRLAEEDPRLRSIHIDRLPDGWLGKVNALAKGVAAASGEYLVMSDADVHVRPDTLRRAVTACEKDGLDLLALIPDYTTASVGVSVVWTVFLRVLVSFVDPDKVRDPRSRAALGSGAFDLVRRSALDATPGFEWLRMETADDMALAMMLKRSGARIEAMDGRDCATVDIYTSVRRFIQGVEKNGGTTAAHPWRFTLGMVAFLAVEYSPFAALAIGPGWLRWTGLAAAVVATLVNMNALWTNTRRWAPALAWPLGSALFAYATMRSTWLAFIRGGLSWRGTFYPLREIDAARRFEF